MPDGGSGMEHLREYRAAADGKRHGNKASQQALAFARRLIFAVATLLVALVWGSASYAQSGPFAGLAGNWSGAGTVTLDDGSTERIRCRATYAVGAGGNGLQQTLTCASDSYKFNIATNVVAQGSAVSGPGAKPAGTSTAISRDAPAAAIFRSSRPRPDFPLPSH